MQGHPHDALPEIELERFDAPRLLLYAIAYHELGREEESEAAFVEPGQIAFELSPKWCHRSG